MVCGSPHLLLALTFLYLRSGIFQDTEACPAPSYACSNDHIGQLVQSGVGQAALGIALVAVLPIHTVGTGGLCQASVLMVSLPL